MLDQKEFGFRDTDNLEALAEEALVCHRCGLRDGCRGVVFGEGDPNSPLVLVGEGPGATEDELGRPFVGAAGQLLDRILESVGFRREEVYITNVVMCRPPGNRLPEPREVTACRPWLDRKLAVIKPQIVVCLGALATQTLVDPAARITRIRGQVVEREGLRIFPTFHPAALLRDPSKKRPVWNDFRQIRAAYDELSTGV